MANSMQIGEMCHGTMSLRIPTSDFGDLSDDPDLWSWMLVKR